MVKQFPYTLHTALRPIIMSSAETLRKSIDETQDPTFDRYNQSLKTLTQRTAPQWFSQTEPLYQSLRDSLDMTFSQGCSCVLLIRLRRMAEEVIGISPAQRDEIFSPGRIGHELQNV